MLSGLSLIAAQSLGLITTATSVSASALTPNNLVQTSTTGSLSALKYTNVGGSGSYDQVVAMNPGTFPSCDISNACVKQTKQVSGNIAPFDTDMTVVFRGPLNLYNVAVYQPANTSAASWNKVSSFASGSQGDNLVFMNNMGGGASGEWDICNGASQSFASSDFTAAAASPNHTTGSLIPDGQEMNIMSAATCSGSNCEGFFRGAAMQGWSDSKLFVMEFDMPSSSSSGQPPAVWALPGQVVRSAQYGCNCRGMGGAGGCGELDIVENLQSGNPDQGISELYSFKGATGSGNGNFFARPTSDKVIYGVTFDVKTDQIAISRWSSFDFSTQSIPRSLIDGYLDAPAMVVPFSTSSKRSHRRTPAFGRRRHGGF